MGICASCLGLDRHPSQDGDLDRILESDQPSYGTVEHNGVAQPDEEELRREREALDLITAEASDHMIDVLQPSQGNLNYGLVMPHQPGSVHDGRADSAAEQHDDNENVDMAAEEAAWLESIESTDLTQLQIPRRGELVMDIGLLRGDRLTTPSRLARTESAY